MPKFSFKGMRIDQRTGFLKALTPIYGHISYPQSLTCYDDVAEFCKWEYEVPAGSWWVEWQSFNVEGSGARTVRPLPLGENPKGSQYLGKFQGGAFQPAPSKKTSSSDIAAAVWGDDDEQA